MTPIVPTDQPQQSLDAANPRRPPPRRVDVRTLLGDAHLLMIDHGDNRYFLRMTRNNKLILTK